MAYNGIKLNKRKEKTKMLLKRDNVLSDERCWWYRLNDHKAIAFEINRDRSIESVILANAKTFDSEDFDVKTLCYMENITLDDGELLNIEALLALAKREDEDKR